MCHFLVNKVKIFYAFLMLIYSHIRSCINSFFEHSGWCGKKNPIYFNLNSFNFHIMRNIKIIPIIFKSIWICKLINCSYLLYQISDILMFTIFHRSLNPNILRFLINQVTHCSFTCPIIPKYTDKCSWYWLIIHDINWIIINVFINNKKK